MSAITSDAGLSLLAPLRPRCATILMLHRFAVPALGVRGHDPAVLAKHLEYLRHRRYRLMSLMELLNQLDERMPIKENSLVFTVDDGYADFATVAAPVFAAYDCPVTVFLVTDFVSGRMWNLFDRVEWALVQTPHHEITLDVPGETIRLRWARPADRQSASEKLIERLKGLKDSAKETSIRNLAQKLEVDIPETVPEQYQAMSWNQVLACARHQVTFGPHTVTHPVLTRVDANRVEYEISESWRAVATATDAAVPVFCYPNGTALDFSSREKVNVERAGMVAALSAIEGCIESSGHGRADPDRYALPRFAYSERHSRFVQIASGLEARKARIRGLFS